jgi:ribonuclease P protein component
MFIPLFMSPLSFKPEERLKHRKLIDQLFKEGTTIVAYPLRFLYITPEGDQLSQSKAGFSVPKRNFKRAVDRNLLKRRIREAYRLQKDSYYQFAEESGLHFAGMFIYVAKEILAYEEIDKAVTKVLTKWKKNYSAIIKD